MIITAKGVLLQNSLFHSSNIPTFQHSKLSPVFRNKSVNRTIVGSFALGCEETAWKLLHLPVISDALATSSFSFTRLISAGASGFVFF